MAEELNKTQLWGWWHDKVKKDNRLYMKAAHKALDIPEDDMLDASNSHNKTGLTWKEILAIGCVLIGGLLGANYLGLLGANKNMSNTPAVTITNSPSASNPTIGGPDTWTQLVPDTNIEAPKQKQSELQDTDSILKITPDEEKSS